MVDPAQSLAPVKQAQHDPFTKLRRDGRNPHVKIIAADPQTDPAILRQPLFSDVEPPHHLDPADQ